MAVWRVMEEQDVWHSVCSVLIHMMPCSVVGVCNCSDLVTPSMEVAASLPRAAGSSFRSTGCSPLPLWHIASSTLIGWLLYSGERQDREGGDQPSFSHIVPPWNTEMRPFCWLHVRDVFRLIAHPSLRRWCCYTRDSSEANWVWSFLPAET